MKKSYRMVLLFILIAVSLYGQDRILVSVSPEIGTEVDREERDKYNWFQDVPNFISARFYHLADGTYDIHIQFFQNGQVNEQRRVITPESFQKDYQNTLMVEKIEDELVERHQRRRTAPIQPYRTQQVNLKLKNLEVKNVIITDIQGDSVYVEKTRYTFDGQKEKRTGYSIADLEHVSVIRNTNVGATLGIGLAPGALAALFHYNYSENDDHRYERVKKVFLLGEAIGLSVSGTIAAMKSIDYDYNFIDLSYEQKKEKMNQYVLKGLRHKAHVRFSPWMGAYHFPNYFDNTIFFPGMRLSICFSPRHRMEIMYGYSDGWSLQNKKFEIEQYRNVKKYTTFNLFKVGLRTDYTYHKSVNLFVAWGWGLLGKEYKSYYDYENHHYENDSNPDIIMNIELGLEHHFNSWTSVEARIGIVENFDYGLHPMAQAGIHFGRFY